MPHNYARMLDISPTTCVLGSLPGEQHSSHRSLVRHGAESVGGPGEVPAYAGQDPYRPLRRALGDRQHGGVPVQRRVYHVRWADDLR